MLFSLFSLVLLLCHCISSSVAYFLFTHSLSVKFPNLKKIAFPWTSTLKSFPYASIKFLVNLCFRSSGLTCWALHLFQVSLKTIFSFFLFSSLLTSSIYLLLSFPITPYSLLSPLFYTCLFYLLQEWILWPGGLISCFLPKNRCFMYNFSRKGQHHQRALW